MSLAKSLVLTQSANQVKMMVNKYSNRALSALEYFGMSLAKSLVLTQSANQVKMMVNKYSNRASLQFSSRSCETPDHALLT